MEDGIRSTKRDKLQIKHSLLLSRLKESAQSRKSQADSPAKKIRRSQKSTGGVNKVARQNALKHGRRRRARNLATNLSDIADALPSLDSEANDIEEYGDSAGSKSKVAAKSNALARQARIVSRSRNLTFKDSTMATEGLRRRAGFQKRVGFLSELERKRFEANLAAISIPTVDSGRSENQDGRMNEVEKDNESVQRKRWAALRSHVSQAIGQKDGIVRE